MFSRIAAFTALVLPVLAVATPAPVARASDSCNTGPIQCCQSTEQADSASASSILSSIGVVLQDPSVLVGLTCSPISVVGVGSGSTCDASPVCCENNSFGSLISIGCVPVSL
ncbi:fungal hydrophobin [Trametopsis cervina]|nr:fungal hydrophobin [Trametopsis cervina]